MATQPSDAQGLENPVIYPTGTASNSRGALAWDKEAQLTDHCRKFLSILGYDTNSPDIVETPMRWARMMIDLEGRALPKLTTFRNPGYDEMIVQKDIAFFSLCEHHLVPFFGTATVAYIPKDKVIGLSKLSRVVEYCASGLQMQERLTTEIADVLQACLKPIGVGVIIRARHLCQEMRGVKKIGTVTTTSRLIGAFRKNAAARREFLDLG